MAREQPDSDERRMIEAAQGDPRLFAGLYDAHFERIYAYALSRVRDRSEAQDITSEVFHQALKNLGRFEWRGVPFSAWLYRIAANAIADQAQRASREQQLGDEGHEARDAAGHANRGAGNDIDHDIDLDEVEWRADIFRCVEDLPVDQRRVIKMRFVEEKSIRDIAKDLGRSEGAVKQLQFRGLQNLRDRLQPARIEERNG